MSASLSEIVELSRIPPKTCQKEKTSTPVKDQLEEKENRKSGKEEESKRKAEKFKKGIDIKRLKRNNRKSIKKSKEY